MNIGIRVYPGGGRGVCALAVFVFVRSKQRQDLRRRRQKDELIASDA